MNKTHWSAVAFCVACVLLVLSTILVNNMEEHKPAFVDSNGQKFNVVVLDGCQYLRWRNSSTYYTHKGNCTNIIHFTSRVDSTKGE